jgi:hypothetical protein
VVRLSEEKEQDDQDWNWNAIAKAVQRPTMKFVATKTAEQLDLQVRKESQLSYLT